MGLSPRIIDQGDQVFVEHQSFPDPVTHAFYRNEQTCRHAILALKRPDPALDPYR
ncbi:MAG: hypothetical protein WBQ45_05790 [Roseiarcus sp.]|uniref:hypothetical protein n=1 Tax=Roseiarcus sp. TaxID=1969460 RepID=UPI003BB08843